jgi:hypothetical protein
VNAKSYNNDTARSLALIYNHVAIVNLIDNLDDPVENQFENEMPQQPDWMELIKPNPNYEEIDESNFKYDDGLFLKLFEKQILIPVHFSNINIWNVQICIVSINVRI